ncbi:MAG: Asp-tRNA(Asn)/Glu-tRNA(Gln) amidotransferase subunit GatA [Phycisphaerales bacterium]|nr:Asp-tRNA(Asn)/Glu-tRNA(Gln) amidotransferase subunit GatA [Phycisphaerae bacterium]NNF41581.1 Asp-tRNA(Asn)/Glu-tRNA(Gln) amidotransferase subunit GatA [Phycisphaerales bacterium]NNM24518.1 Asp-tRNA(Asn)/Glu-tRNA(Gln) amidotransferase subunit GatA [Phycisphaerales bacterium]
MSTDAPIASLADVADAHRRGATTVEATVRSCLERVDRRNDELNSFREVHHAEALAAASTLDERLARGDDVGPLAGVPVAVKDNIVTRAGTTCCGSRILEGYRSPFTATAVERLAAAGAIVIGKTNCDEFAMGSSSEHCAYGPVRNPWDPARVPGGSSGGSAAAVAGGQCPAALGSDTGGSVRQPAALCGVVGVKPSYGRVSRWGLVAFGSSLDQIGPFAASVADAARLLGVMAGPDERDSTCADVPVPDYLARLETPPDPLRIGVPRQYLGDGNDPAVSELIAGKIQLLREAGATIIDIDLPLTTHGIATYYVIAPAEASSNLARFDGIRYGRRAKTGPGDDLFDLYARSRAEGFGPEVKRRIMLGTYVLSAGYYDAYYVRALKVRRLIKNELDGAFAHCDAILGPTSPVPAFPLGERADPLTMYRCDVYTAITNIAGICGISVPAGTIETDGRRLPVGLHLQCPAFAEETMFRIARVCEQLG